MTFNFSLLNLSKSPRGGGSGPPRPYQKGAMKTAVFAFVLVAATLGTVGSTSKAAADALRLSPRPHSPLTRLVDQGWPPWVPCSLAWGSCADCHSWIPNSPPGCLPPGMNPSPLKGMSPEFKGVDVVMCQLAPQGCAGCHSQIPNSPPGCIMFGQLPLKPATAGGTELASASTAQADSPPKAPRDS